jgi:hypothetical protein
MHILSPYFAHIILTTTEAFIFSNSLFLKSRFLCYQRSCHSCFYLAIILNFLAVKILLQGWKQKTTARRRISPTYSHSVCILQL